MTTRQSTRTVLGQDGPADTSRRIAVYEWSAWDGFLFPAVFPQALRVPASLGDVPYEIFGRADEWDRVGWWVFHLDLSRTERFPLLRSELLKILDTRGIQTINAGVTDITKRRIREQNESLGLPTAAALRDGAPEELVVLKTNLNYGGESEQALTPAERVELSLDNTSVSMVGIESYRILPRRLVSEALWMEKGIVIERYVHNADRRIYRAYVLLDRLVISEAVGIQPLQRMAQGLERRNWLIPSTNAIKNGDTPPPSGLSTTLVDHLIAFISAFQLEYGTIDVVRDDDFEYYIIDVNTTPYWGSESHGEILHHLRSALEESR